ERPWPWGQACRRDRLGGCQVGDALELRCQSWSVPRVYRRPTRRLDLSAWAMSSLARACALGFPGGTNSEEGFLAKAGSADLGPDRQTGVICACRHTQTADASQARRQRVNIGQVHL